MRRLPVLQTPPDDGPARPLWQWRLIGAGLAGTIWAPLCVIAEPLGVRLASYWAHSADAGPLAAQSEGFLAWLSAAPIVVSFAIAAAVAGVILVRVGPARARDAAFSGTYAGTGAALTAAVAGGLPFLVWILAAAVLAAVGAGSAFLGAKLPRGGSPGNWGRQKGRARLPGS